MINNRSRRGHPADPSFACIRCWKLKKKCDKQTPRCKRCESSGFHCVYSEQAPTGRSKNVHAEAIESGRDITTQRFNWYHSSLQSLSPAAIGIENSRLVPAPPSPESDSTNESHRYGHTSISQLNSPIFAPFHAIKHDLGNVLKTYMATINVWFAIVLQSQMPQLELKDGRSPDVETCTLLLAIYLVTQQPPSGSNFECLYTVIKSFHSTLHLVSNQSIPIIQAGILLALYEQGQGLHQVCYITIGASVRLAQSIGLHQTIRLDVGNVGPDRVALEEQRHIWWTLVIVERILSLQEVDVGQVSPCASAAPTLQDYIPSVNPKPTLDNGAVELGESSDNYSRYPSIHLPLTSPHGESVQCTYLLAKVLEHISNQRMIPAERQIEVDYLDGLLQSYMARTLDDERRFQKHWYHSCGAFFISMSARLRLHMYHLQQLRLPPSTIETSGGKHRSLLAINTIARIGTDSKTTAHEIGQTDEFLRQYNMPPFTLNSSRDVLKIGLEIMGDEDGIATNGNGLHDRGFWERAFKFYLDTFRVAGRKWKLGDEYLKWAEEQSASLDHKSSIIP